MNTNRWVINGKDKEFIYFIPENKPNQMSTSIVKSLYHQIILDAELKLLERLDLHESDKYNYTISKTLKKKVKEKLTCCNCGKENPRYSNQHGDCFCSRKCENTIMGKY